MAKSKTVKLTTINVRDNVDKRQTYYINNGYIIELTYDPDNSQIDIWLTEKDGTQKAGIAYLE